MQLALTVADPVTQSLSDVLVEVDEDATVDELARELLTLLRSAPAGAVTSLASRRAGGTETLTGPCRLYLEGEQLDGRQAVRDSPVREGSLLGVDEPPTPVVEPAGLHDLSITSGPGAGLVHRLPLGETAVGSASSCTGRFEVPGLPAHACTVRVGLDGCTLVPCPGVDLLLEHEPVEDEVPWPDGACLTVGDSLLVLRAATVPDAAMQPSPDGVSLDYNRPPRLLPPLRKTSFELPSPPVEPRGRSFPLLAILAPIAFAVVLVLVLGSLRYALFAMMSPVMAIGNFVTNRSGSRKEYKEQLQHYTARKAQVEQDAHEALLAERANRRDQAPDPAEALLIASGPRARLWERRRDDPDYLVLRVATADLPSQVSLSDPEQLHHRREVVWRALDAPVSVSLAERGVVGLAGRRDLTAPLAAWMTAQAAVLHSPRDVRLYVLSDAGSREDWAWVRWLPHSRPEQRRDAAVLVGTDADSLARRLGELQAELAARTAVRSGSGAAAALTDPDVVVVLDGARRLRLLPGVVQVLKEGPAVGIYCLCLDTDERLLPEECAAVVVQTGETTVTVRQQRADVVTDARADLVPPAWFDRVARALAPVKDVTDQAGDSALPDGCRLLDVVGLEPPTAAGIAAVWTRGGRTTEAVVGMSMDGPFALDLRRDGPHALVAGTTGAGKSELLQTLVASLALANRPDAMTFVLVDYKGGSAFKDCVDLPHTVGMVTDLDTHLVERALTSLAAELHRREHLLAGAGAKDIEDYTDLAARDPVLGPMPRLAIVIDEFASMARELPDFVTGLVNIAQRGRSLGIHLVLATQRPSGVVSPEIRANTNLRIALRVTDRAESTDVIDAPDASLISKSTPGRAYVRLGAASLVPFQAGRVGGRRPGEAGVVARPAPWLVPLDWPRLGHPVPSRPPVQEAETDAAATDLGALVTAIRTACAELALPPQHSPWLPALPTLVRLADLPAPESSTGQLPAVAYALADLPGQQAQRAEVVDLSTLGHRFVIGSPRSGRTQTLRTIAGALATTLSSADVHLYGLDCGSGGLLPLTALPHCGAVVQRTQTDRVARLLNRLVEEVAARQEVLSAGGFASVTEQRQSVGPQQRLPHLVLLLDRWESFLAGLAELDGGKLQAAVMTLLHEGASAGVHCIVSGDRTLSNYRMSSVTEDKLVLRMADRSDYTATGLNARTMPDTLPDGRGFQPDGNVEVQVAVLDGPVTGQGQAAALTALGAEATARDAAVPRSQRPFRIDVLPASLSYPAAADFGGQGRPPLWALVGVGGDDLDARGPDLAVTPVFLVAGPAKSGRSTVLTAMARWLLDHDVPLVVVAPRPSPLRELTGLRGLLTGDTLTPEDLAPLLEPDGPMVLMLDDAELHKDTKAAELLKTYLRTAGDCGRGLVVGGSTTDLAAGYSGWHAEARKGRAGALLSPQGLADGELVGVRLPRSLVGEPIKPGRAHLHLSDGALVTVTVPRVD
ncbi:MAG: FtsK/SpoIIIE domain-containing protein [Mycobacteriales bacterium]